MTIANEIAASLQAGIKTAAERKIGIEVEKLAVWKDGAPFTYRERTLPTGQLRVGAAHLLAKLEENFAWKCVRNAEGLPLGLETPHGKVSLEPGSQVELSTAPEVDLFQVERHVRDFEKVLDGLTHSWGLVWLPLAVNPFLKVEDIDVIPLDRYRIMTEYLGTHGALSTAMMRLTTSVQVNLDYTSEAEAIEMFRVALAVAPVSYALFGNSPYFQGQANAFLSNRGHIWEETDPIRTGLLPRAFDADFSFEKYAELLADLPLMYAFEASGNAVAAQGKSLNEIAQGALPGVEVTAENRKLPAQQLFTEARLKPGYLEIRSIDGLTAEYRIAATAFWTGLLYDEGVRHRTWERLKALSAGDRKAMFDRAIRKGLKDPELAALAESLVEESRLGLRHRLKGEESQLEVLRGPLARKENPAQVVLNAKEISHDRTVSC